VADQLSADTYTPPEEAPPPANHMAVDLRELGVIDYFVASTLLTTHRDLRRDGGRLLITGGPLELTWFVELVGPDPDLELVVEPGA
jgi:anti-anti-sigma regulatory factor